MKKSFDKPTQAYKSMREYNKKEGYKKYGVVEGANNTYQIINISKNPNTVVNKTRKLASRKNVPSFNMKNTIAISGRKPKLTKEEEKKFKRGSLKAGQPIVGIARAKLKEGIPIDKTKKKYSRADIVKFRSIEKEKQRKKNARERLKKGLVLDGGMIFGK